MVRDNKMGKAKKKAKDAMDVGSEKRKRAEAGKTEAARQAAREQADDAGRNGPMESIRRDDRK
ncbi:hypothetical protein [Streptomyces sp. NPDC049040]|uniref:hypothetical protein n=1 Tax=Streptomyces sp. NPDC049040 TaxID=3365593 RepID=UPI0037133E37